MGDRTNPILTQHACHGKAKANYNEAAKEKHWSVLCLITMALVFSSLPVLPKSDPLASGKVAVCLNVHAGDTGFDFAKHKSKFMGSLPDGYFKWMANTLRLAVPRWVMWANLAEEVLPERIEINPLLIYGLHRVVAISSLEMDVQQRKRSVLRGVGKRRMSGNDAILTEKTGQLKKALDRLDQQGAQTSWDTFASLLRQCADAKALVEGKRLHEHIMRNGFRRNRFLGNLLVHMYSSCGSLEDARAVFDGIIRPNAFSRSIMISAYSRNGLLEDARRIFDTMPRPDVVSWNAMIAAYAQNRRAQEAIELFERMGLEGVKPDKVTFICLVDACASLATLSDSQGIHASIVECGFESDVTVGSALVNMYGKCGSPDDARSVFDKMPRPNVISWTAMISAYSQNGRGEEALELSRWMEIEGVKPDRITFICLIDACTSLAALEQGQSIHASIVDSGFETDIVVGNALINMYGKCGSLDDAKHMFDKMPKRNVVTWTTMIGVYAQNGHCKEALEHFRQMELEGVKPDKITFLCIVDACASLAVLAQGQEIHASIVDRGFETDVVLGSALVHMYGKCGSPDHAKSVFDTMRRQNAVSWNAMIGAYVQNGHGKEALELFQQMGVEGVKPDKITFICVIDACASLATLVQGKAIHTSIVDAGFETDLVVASALVNMYGKCGSSDDARSVFDKMPQRNVVSWTAMIAAYAQNGHGKKALDLFERMDLEGVKPNRITFISILDACANMAALAQGEGIHASIVNDGIDIDSVVGSALVSMYGKCGCPDYARKVFDKMSRRDTVSWTAMITAYSQNGHGKETLELFAQMDLEGVKPDKITFVSILAACSHAGLLDDGWRYFVFMSRDHGITPIAEHYACMIDLIGRAGQLDDAEDLINNMPFQPDAVAWKAFLGACRIYGSVEQGACAAKHVFKLDSKQAGAYVLLSNIYAAAGRHTEVAKVRQVMDARGVNKHPGLSCIEVKKRVHQFVVGDASHPQREEIYAELQRLISQMEEAGYMPDTKAVLHDVEAEEKGQLLCYHSEKLAIAFGLISNPVGAPLYIIKNLRVCSDCHVVTKFISKIVGLL